YRLVAASATADSNIITVPWAPANGDGRYLVQSLDGRTVVPIAAWIDNQLPQAPVLHTTGFDVRGRRRPVMVFAVAGEGTMQVVWRLDRAASDLLDKIIADGGGIALRTDGTARDLPVSDVAVITSASSALWEADNGVSTDRVWDLELTWIDDPEPSTIPVVWDVGEVDALLAGSTVGDVDAMFAGLTVAEVDAIDWGTVTPP
ncbi:hypothetical protein, partial [Isoptericola hypogeus]|uniref:hypothetical protein n=1 Tax=Isoptericola hypogeus TaxID=300179 RepID=UPI0031E2C169